MSDAWFTSLFAVLVMWCLWALIDCMRVDIIKGAMFVDSRHLVIAPLALATWILFMVVI